MSSALDYTNCHTELPQLEPAAHLRFENVTDRSGASTDEQLVHLWIQTKQSARTREEYAREFKRFASYLSCGVSLRTVTFADLTSYKQQLESTPTKQGTPLKPATVARAVAAIKSLLTFAHELGYVTFNVGVALKAPSTAGLTANRILLESEVIRLVLGAKNTRDRVMLKLLYNTGLRVNELTALTWEDITQGSNGCGVLTVRLGKGGKTRAVIVPASLYAEVLSLRGRQVTGKTPVFKSRSKSKDGTYHLSKQQVNRVIRAAAKTAGLEQKVSAHWLRHCNASHALDRGAPISLVQASLGHASVATTGKYLHAKPDTSAGMFLVAV